METLFFSSLLHTLTFLPPVIPHASFCSFMHNQGWLCGSQRQTHQQNIAPCIVTQLYFMSVREAEYSFHHCKLHFSNGIACYNFFYHFFFQFHMWFQLWHKRQTLPSLLALQKIEAMVFTSITLQQDQAELGSHLHEIHIARNDLALYSYNKWEDWS